MSCICGIGYYKDCVFLVVPGCFWVYFAVFRGGYYKKSRFCVVPAVMGVFSLCKEVDLKYIVLYLRHR